MAARGTCPMVLVLFGTYKSHTNISTNGQGISPNNKSQFVKHVSKNRTSRPAQSHGHCTFFTIWKFFKTYVIFKLFANFSTIYSWCNMPWPGPNWCDYWAMRWQGAACLPVSSRTPDTCRTMPWQGHIFHIVGPFWVYPLVTGGFPSQKASNVDTWYFFDVSLNKQFSCQCFEMMLMWHHQPCKVQESCYWASLWKLPLPTRTGLVQERHNSRVLAI